MSRLFEFLQNLNSVPGDSSSKSDAPSDKAETILSVLHRPEAAEHEKGGGDFDLGRLPAIEVHPAPADRLVFHTDPDGLAADRFRLLRIRLRELAKTGKLRSLLITSPAPGDGKSTVAANLANALIGTQKTPVLLIDADLHGASLTERVGLAGEPGLANCLTGPMRPMGAIKRIDPLGWYFLPAGVAADAPTGLLHTDAFSSLMKEVAGRFEWVLLDCPPILPITDAAFIVKHVDGALLVARADATPAKAIEDAITLLGRERVTGVILNSIAGLQSSYSPYHEYYRRKSKSQHGRGALRAPAAASPLLDSSNP